MSARLELRIFLSSPGDVSDERGLTRRVLNGLSQEYGLRDRVHFEEVLWDDPGAPVPLDAHLTPQEAINNRCHKPSECDIAVVILSSRMGTPRPTSEVRQYAVCLRHRGRLLGGKKDRQAHGACLPAIGVPVVGLDDPKHDERLRQFKAGKSSLPVSPTATVRCGRATRHPTALCTTSNNIVVGQKKISSPY